MYRDTGPPVVPTQAAAQLCAFPLWAAFSKVPSHPWGATDLEGK